MIKLDLIVSVPMGYPHTVKENVKLAEYTIPKNALVFFHLQAAHNDHTYWKRPQEFRPDRFLDDGEEIKHDCFFPFSVGENYIYLFPCWQQLLFTTESSHSPFLVIIRLMIRSRRGNNGWLLMGLVINKYCVYCYRLVSSLSTYETKLENTEYSPKSRRLLVWKIVPIAQW